MALATATQILKAFCRQEILGDITELAVFLVDLDDIDCPVQFINNDNVREFEEKVEALELEEPDQYLDYDAWLAWEMKLAELEAEVEEAANKAAQRISRAEEWWLCTKRLGEKLKEHGEIIIFYNDFAFWGKEASMVGLEYNKTIKDIATEIEILPGMSHDWSKHIELE